MRTTLRVLAFAFTALTALPCNADDDIVVTATRSPTPTQILPARIEIIDRATIEAQALVSLAAALGPDAVQAGGAGQQTSLFLRGANSKHVLALYDGIRINDASTPNAQYDFGLDTLGGLERVEVLRGPASAVYGSDAIGGVVNLIPRQGGARRFAPFAEVSAGSFGTLRALIGGAGTNNGLSYGLSGEHFFTDGYDLIPSRMTTRTGDPDGARVTTLAANARLDRGVYVFDMLLRRRDSEAEFDTFSGGPFFDLRADDPALRTSATQSIWRAGAEMEAGAALNMRLSGGQVLSERSDADSSGKTGGAESTRTFADALAHYAFNGVTLTGGLSFERNAIATRSQFSDPLMVAENQSAAFLIGQFQTITHLSATASVRADNYERFGSQTTYSLGAVWDVAPARVFASYGTAFKAPSLSERFEMSFFNVGNPDLRPESSRSWEIGADWRAASALTLGASYYQTRIADLIEYDFAQLRNINIGRATIDGAEMYLEANPTSASSLRISHTWADARSDDTGAHLARRPSNAWRLDANVHLNDKLKLALSWQFVGARTDVTYDNTGGFESGGGRTSGFNLGALAATYDLNASAAIFVRIDNITDQTYEQPAAFAGAPRAVQVGLRSAF